jgi:predicted O-methyltransferase YrrM
LAQGIDLKESDFRDLELKLRLDSDSAGVSRIDFEDGLVLYSVLFTHLSGASGAKVLDLGSAMGYSTLWISKALEEACSGQCDVIAAELRGERVRAAQDFFKGVELRSARVSFVEGDAVSLLEGIDDESIDAAFVDVHVSLYPKVAELLLRKLRRGGVAMFHNAIRPPPPAETFQVLSRTGWRFAVVPTLEGILITRKP